MLKRIQFPSASGENHLSPKGILAPALDLETPLSTALGGHLGLAQDRGHTNSRPLVAILESSGFRLVCHAPPQCSLVALLHLLGFADLQFLCLCGPPAFQTCTFCFLL